MNEGSEARARSTRSHASAAVFFHLRTSLMISAAIFLAVCRVFGFVLKPKYWRGMSSQGHAQRGALNARVSGTARARSKRANLFTSGHERIALATDAEL